MNAASAPKWMTARPPHVGQLNFLTTMLLSTLLLTGIGDFAGRAHGSHGGGTTLEPGGVPMRLSHHCSSGAARVSADTISATLARITAPARSVWNVTGSLRLAQPSATATTGFT